MKKLFVVAMITCVAMMVFADWAGNHRYAEANRGVPPGSVVLFGDSITDSWPRKRPEFFSETKFVGRGISGQTTAQMLCRFRNDVINLRPRAVVILAGTNDMAENNGPIRTVDAVGNIMSMCELAKANGIRVVLCSVTPAAKFPWRPQITDVVARIDGINRILKSYADVQGIPWLDYNTLLNDGEGGMGDKADDGLHPNGEGYAIMEGALVLFLKKVGI